MIQYVRTFLASGRFLVKHFGSSKLITSAFNGVYENYHAKVLTFNDAKKILTLNRDIIMTPEVAKRIIPFSAANKIIFKEPEYIAVMDCPCRLSRKNHCEPVNVCMAVGRTTAQFWLEHCSKYHVRKVSQQEALDLLRQSVKLNRIIAAWFKTETGGRTGVICSCCSCCCGGLEGMRLSRKLPGTEKLINVAPSGYSVEINPALCKSCGSCIKTCAFDAQKPDDKGGPIYDVKACFGCGVCVAKCPFGARRLVTDKSKGIPLDVEFQEESLSTY